MIQPLACLLGKFGKSDTGAAECVCPRDVPGSFQLTFGVGKIKAQVKAAITIEGHHRLHRETLLAEVEDHAAGNAVEAGEHRSIHFVAHATASFGKHGLTCHRALILRLHHCPYINEHTRDVGGTGGRVRIRAMWIIGSNQWDGKYTTGFSGAVRSSRRLGFLCFR